MNWTEVRYQHISAMRAVLVEAGAKPATINHVLAAVRGTLREAWRLRFIDAETLARAVDGRGDRGGCGLCAHHPRRRDTPRDPRTPPPPPPLSSRRTH
ncbi:MAG: hypothetical protein OXJ62_09380 [Spirochaetaceae bacterium]|nr:hypothetical protein [Spirochaetaceae bacterium]